MRAWLPEREVYGPEPAGERDTDALNRVFADAFTDRYRRDGLVGVRVPHLNPQVWRYALLDAGAGAMLWRDEAGHVVGLLRRLADRFPQVILITHIEQVREGLDRVIRVDFDPARGTSVVRDDTATLGAADAGVAA